MDSDRELKRLCRLVYFVKDAAVDDALSETWTFELRARHEARVEQTKDAGPVHAAGHVAVYAHHHLLAGGRV
jgi:hypothetical protein